MSCKKSKACCSSKADPYFDLSYNPDRCCGPSYYAGIPPTSCGPCLPASVCRPLDKVDKLKTKVAEYKVIVASLTAAVDELRKTVVALEKRVTILEFAPGGPEFTKILDEAKEAGDFSS